MKRGMFLLLIFLVLIYPTYKSAGQNSESPWGIGCSAEWSGEYSKFNLLLKDAGIKYLRLFPEWQTIQPEKNIWNWELADKIVEDAKKNNLKILGIWCYFARWASADGSTRKGPIKDINFWKEYVRETAKRYKNEIKYWEVWNEFNGSFYIGKDKVKEYAELVKTAYDEVKKIDPSIKVGMSVANFDVGFLNKVIKNGAGSHFDFICVHPYENLSELDENGEVSFLSMADNLRKMLKDNNQPQDIELWITEVGYPAPTKPDTVKDLKQAEILLKCYILSLVQGFNKIFWFEARGPSYGKDTDFGIIRHDWSLRPSYYAYKTIIELLGDCSQYTGWIQVEKGLYGFVFKGREKEILVLWAEKGKEAKISFKKDVQVIKFDGSSQVLKSNHEIKITGIPVFIRDIPSEIIKLSKENRKKQYPWGKNYSNAKVVSCKLGSFNIEDGLKQINLHTTEVFNIGNESCRKLIFNDPKLNFEGHYVYFRIDPTFASYGDKNFEIVVVAKVISPDKPAGMNLCYESEKGYRLVENGWRNIPCDCNWHQLKWKIDDANFVGQWGWNFRIDAISSKNEFYIKEVKVIKIKEVR